MNRLPETSDGKGIAACYGSEVMREGFLRRGYSPGERGQIGVGL